MRTILGSALGILILALITPASAQPLHFWSQRFGGTGSDVGNGVAVDASGNVVMTGSFGTPADFGGGNLPGSMFLAKYNANGMHVWSQGFGGGPASANAIALDGSGNVVMIGAYVGTISFGGGNLPSAGGLDIVVAKYNANGAHQWSKRFGGASNDFGYGVAVDGSGNVFVTGAFQGTVNFGGANLVSAGGYDIFLAKFDAGGAHQWSQRFGGTRTVPAGDPLNVEAGNAVAVDASGNVVVTGAFSISADFGGGSLNADGLANTDIFVAKYNSSGAHLWSQSFGSLGHDSGTAVAVDGAGNTILTGYFGGTANFGGGNLVTAGGYDIFLAKYNSNGAHQWSQRFGGTGGDANNLEAGKAIAVDGSGNLVLTGSFTGTTDFGTGSLASAGGLDIFVAKYDATGACQWSMRSGSSSSDQGRGVALGGLGKVVVTGSCAGAVNFGGGNLLGAGGNDVFLAKYSETPLKPLITSIADVPGDQGKKVRIQFSRAGDDEVGNATPVTHYEAYRRDDVIPSAMAGPPAGSLSRTQLLDAGWVYAGDAYAHGAGSYLMDAPTDADSTIASGQHYSVFFIRAALTPGVFFDSPVDSGYSRDNLAPGVPSNFTYAAGELSWDEPGAKDLDHFSVYGSNTNSFGTATLVNNTTNPELGVTGSPYAFYFVTATDVSGNEGKPAVVSTVSGGDGTPKSYVLSISAHPNPFNPEATIRYTLPAKGHVTVEVFDTRGERVATLVDAEQHVGEYTVAWNGRDDRGATTGSGVYFARLTTPAGARSYKMTLLK